MLSFSNGNVINLGNIKGSKGDKGDKGDSGLNGKDGVGIQNVDVSADGALTVTLTNGTVLNLGNIKGADGLGITKAEINTSGELVLTYSNGDVKNLGKVSGENGKDGANGADGLGIKALTLSPDGELVVTMSDNSISNLGNIKGEKGDRGEQGQQGLQGSKGADGRGILRTEISGSKLVIYYTDNTTEEHDLSGISGGTENPSSEILKFVKLSDGTYGVRANDTVNIKDLVSVDIPATYKGIAVTQIMAEGFKDAISLESITLPDSITKINQYAFNNCNVLKNIDLPSDLTYIGEFAFYGCNSLSSLNLNMSKNWVVSVYAGDMSHSYYDASNGGTTTLTVKYGNRNVGIDMSTDKKTANFFTNTIYVDST